MVPLSLVIQFQQAPPERVALFGKLLTAFGLTAAVCVLLLWLVGRGLRRLREQAPWKETARAAGGDSALAMAAVQAVIQRLREQEKELERLHRAERQRAEESEQLSATIMRDMATGLLVANAQGIITESNPAAKAVLGHQMLLGRSFREVFTPPGTAAGPPIVQNFDDCLSSGQTFRRVTVSYLAPSGENKVLGIGISPIRSEGQVGGAICLLTDLTEITALQQQVRLKENLAALGEMSAGIAHEFKNSLATISGYAQLIKGEDTVEGARQHAARIVAETQFLTQIVTDFLNFSRPMNLVACEVSTRELIETSFEETIQRGDFANTRLEMSGNFPVLVADQTLLRQCFVNLIRNGCEAIAEAGRPQGLMRVEGQLERGDTGPVVRLAFRDNGTGIEKQNLERVFIPFFTTKSAGTGLGLALVHKIIVNHNGKIQVASEPGAGTTFTLTLPAGATTGTGAGA